jgi:hypothetical protein
VTAHVYTVGPDGEEWTLVIPAQGEVSLSISYMLHPMGELKGAFIVGAQQRETIRHTIETQDFMNLPERLEPQQAPLHAPSLTLTVRLGETVHEVYVYNPDHFKHDPDGQRFLAVWNQAFTVVPLKPTW